VASEEKHETIIKVKVLPRSSKSQIVGKEDDIYKVKLTAPPVEGKANKALKELFAKRLGIPKMNVEIISGEFSRVKSVRIHGLNINDINCRLIVNT
jgi:uncharacterized protein (TIGR00251 family)